MNSNDEDKIEQSSRERSFGQVDDVRSTGTLRPEVDQSTNLVDRIVVPLVEETLSVDKEWVQAGKVIIRKEVTTRTQEVPVEILHEELDVQRVQVNRALLEGEHAESRQEGDTLIIPVVDEELVVTKRYVVREELRVTKRKVAEQQQVSDTVRSEQLFIEPSGNLEASQDKGPQ